MVVVYACVRFFQNDKLGGFALCVVGFFSESKLKCFSISHKI
jgi:hypothetical protein